MRHVLWQVLSPRVVLIICQLFVLGHVKAAGSRLPEKGLNFEEDTHILARSVAKVETEIMASGDHSSQFAASSQIGSRPPSCQNKCNMCKPCRAIQAPTPLPDQRPGSNGYTAAQGQIMSGYFANYKPESWKCKCGNRFFNP